jgi:hypothetical protein
VRAEQEVVCNRGFAHVDIFSMQFRAGPDKAHVRRGSGMSVGLGSWAGLPDAYLCH